MVIFIRKMKKWFKLHKKEIFKILLVLLFLVIVSVSALGIFFATNVLYFDNGIKFNLSKFDNIRGKWWFYLVFLALQVLSNVFLSFVPASNMAFIIGGVSLFGANIKTFLLCYLGVVIASVIMDLIGRFGGSKLIQWLLGKEDYDKALKLIDTKGKTYVPFMYLLPLFPDDAVCMCCGAIKLNFWLHLLYITLCRGIGVATIVFGLEIIPYKSFTTFYDWFILGACIIVYLGSALKVAKAIDKYLSNRKNKK